MQHARSPASASSNSGPLRKKRNTNPTRSISTTTPVAVPVNSDKLAGRGFTQTRFSDFLTSGAISQQTANGIQHEFCTQVQEATLPIILTGVDVLAQAKTGTGKTVAFLVPSIERLVRSSPPPPMGQISILILSPTRELAIQIEEEARILLSGTSFKVQHVVGGTNMKSETNRLNKERCDILVGTPGRMIDHLENSNVKGKLAQVRIVILDEADRLLEQGFRRELTKILECLPDRKRVSRQTLLFSATVPAQVHQIANIALLPDFSFISTISEEETNTHDHVPQHSIITSLNDILPATLVAIRMEQAAHKDATKIICFLPTARATGLAAAVFARVNLGIPVTEIHSRKSQSARNAAAESFKSATSGVLFSSDVTARGMDFLNVTTVLQVGLPANPEQYIHRLGRTARAGAAGTGIVILAEFETFFLRKREIVALSVSPHPASSTTLATESEMMQQARRDIALAMSTVDDETKSQFYAASLGFYKPFIRDTFGSAERMVSQMNDYAMSPSGLAFDNASGAVPGMMATTIGKMGLRGTAGLHIVHSLPGKEGGGGGGGRGGARGGGGGGRGGARGGGGAGRGGAGAGRGGGGGGGRGRGMAK